MIKGPMRATVDDFDSIIELVDECFIKDRESGGMLARWPHCYIRKPETMRNFLIMKDGKRAVSGVEYVDQTVMVEGNEIKVAGISGVATLPDYRGQGLMTKLLRQSIQFMQQEGYAFSDLGGDRLRYGRYGWEKAGRAWSFSVTRRSLGPVNVPSGYTIAPYQGSAEELDSIIALHEQEGCGRKRTHELYELLLKRKGWEVWLAKTNSGIEGYAVTVPGKLSRGIVEFGGSSNSIHAILCHLTKALDSASLSINSPWQNPLNTLFFSVCAHWSIGTLRMVKILDLEATMNGFAKQLGRRFCKNSFYGSRSITLGVEETGQKVQITFTQDGVDVSASNNSGAFMLPEREMVRFLFCPGGIITTSNLPQHLYFLESLLPLDFYLWHLETV